MYGHVPEAFAQVVLHNRTTWANATLREWIEMREHLLEKERQQGKPEEWIIKRNHNIIETCERLAREVPNFCGTLRPAAASEVSKRQSALMDEIHFGKGCGDAPLTDWEKEFLRVSTWLDEALEIAERDGPKPPIGLLVEWVLSVELSEDLAKKRNEKRHREREAMTPPPGKQSTNRKNPFYPHPLELVHVARVVHIVIERTQQRFVEFSATNEAATGSRASHVSLVRQFLSTGDWYCELTGFINELKRLGYRRFRNEQECISWPHWKRSFNEDPWNTTRALLAFLYNVSNESIKTDLKPSRLKKAYDAKPIIAPGIRVFHTKEHPPRVGVLFRSGWSNRLHNGRPSPLDIGTTYCSIRDR